ncbi:MAG: cytochrome c peroxidase [Alcanivoracaceae bacterium]
MNKVIGARLLAVMVLVALMAGCREQPAATEVVPPDNPAEPGDPVEPELPDPPVSDDDLDARLRATITALGLSGDPAAGTGVRKIVPNAMTSPKVKLGQLLFYSRTLSGDLDVACASCHQTHLGGGDGLSLPVGVAARIPGLLGPGREIDPSRDQDPQRDGGPNVPRNSQTIFNVGLYNRALFHDGRAHVMVPEFSPGGAMQPIRTPESGNVADPDAGANLLQAQARFPLVSHREMRNFRYPELADPEDYRQLLVSRLRGTAEAWKLDPLGPERWYAHFCAAFCLDSGMAPESLISLRNVQRALAAFQSSQLFVVTPWRAYVEGNDQALDVDARRGAWRFHTAIAEGGLGCVSCHAGDRFTDEGFHNIGFPQIGRGRRTDHSDPGRWAVTQRAADRFAFRTPGLLNIEVTGPWGHAGTFATLEDLLHYHADPIRGADRFYQEHHLLRLPQFAGANPLLLYSYSEALARDALAAESFVEAEQKLPGRALSAQEVHDLKAFLLTLTDPCVKNDACVGRWVPKEWDDPDGNQLNLDEQVVPVDGESVQYPASIDLAFPSRPWRHTFYEVSSACEEAWQVQPQASVSRSQFVRRGTGDDGFGTALAHGWRNQTWFSGTRGSHEMSMFAGGVTAFYPDGECLPGLAFAGGESSGVVVLRNRGNRSGFDLYADAFVSAPSARVTGVAVADLNGDYRRELMLGNFQSGEVPIYGVDADSRYRRLAALPMGRSTFGISFADYEGSGYPGFYLAHWATDGVPGSAPALWRNDGGDRLVPNDGPGGTSSAVVDQTFNFTPLFADMTGDGRQDLLLVSDFTTTQTLKNEEVEGRAVFTNTTDRDVITDENGMGGVLADFFNRGQLDWFVGSIFDPGGEPRGNWGVSGNRFYRNVSTPGELRFEDMTATVGADIADGLWSWGVCAADFNNDGFTDIFLLNGFGYIPDGVVETEAQEQIRARFEWMTESFRQQPPRLYINNGDGTFSEQAAEWAIDVPSEGTGLACFDYDRDGDIDIVLVDQSSGLQFYENQTGHGAGRAFVGIRLVGAAPNTDALGARVYVTADVGGGAGIQRQMRVSQANSNFNGQNLPDMHIGLGAAEVIDLLEVIWPDGTRWQCENAPVNQFMVMDQRAGLHCPE